MIVSKFTGAFTGDTTNLGMYLAIALIAFILLILIVFFKRRKKDEDQGNKGEK